MLKDLLALANAEFDGKRYLIWGVKDIQTERLVFPFEPSRNFDDAPFQEWVQNAIEPTVPFGFSLVPWEAGKVVGVFTVLPSTQKPFVAIEDVGGKLYKGQVWFRRGTRNTVALREDLQRFFTDSGVRLQIGFQESNAQLISKIQIPVFNQATVRPKEVDLFNVRQKLQKLRTENQTLKDLRIYGSEPSVLEKSKISQQFGQSGVFASEPVKIPLPRSDKLALQLTEFGNEAKSEEFRFNYLERRRTLLSAHFGQDYEYIGSEEKKFTLFCELERMIEGFEHDLSEARRIAKYQSIEIWACNIGHIAAQNLEIIVRPTGPNLLRLYPSKPDARPRPNPHSKYDSSSLQAAISGYAPTYEVNQMLKSSNKVKLLVPDKLAAVDWFAVDNTRKGAFHLRVEIRGQEIPKMLEFDLEIDVM